jgi:sulfite exporter TauE/SafE
MSSLNYRDPSRSAEILSTSSLKRHANCKPQGALAFISSVRTSRRTNRELLRYPFCALFLSTSPDRMTADLATLSITAVTVGFFHCVCGPDHYVPFVAMARVGVWSLRKTLLVTLLCGIGHVVGSAVLGMLGVALGLIVFQLETAEAMRGTIAGWLLFAFGVAYFVIGIVYAARHREDLSTSEREVLSESTHRLSGLSRRASFAPWALFVIFLFGPCEPLIPLLMYPAAQASFFSVLCVTALFGLTTLVTMTTLVLVIYRGANFLRFHEAQVYGHTVAGLAVMLCGAAIVAGL